MQHNNLGGQDTRILVDKTPEEAFADVKPEVSHFHIFGCPIYIHVSIEKWTKLEHSKRKGLFVGYNETPKAYRVYIPEQRKTVVSKDVKFEEAFASRKSHEPVTSIEDEEQEALKVEPGSPLTSKAVQQPSSEEETVAPSTSVRRSQWFTQTLRNYQEYVEAPESTFIKKRPSKKFADYMALMSSIIYFEPSSFQEATDQQVWRDAMVEEYTSIMKNDVWDIVSRLEGTSVVSSKWLNKIKHATKANIEEFKARFVAKGFSQKEGVDYEETFAPVTSTLPCP
jgi:hypothetical protein